jgi:hypothetical protein
MTLNSRRILGQVLYSFAACGLLLSCSKVGHSAPDGTTYSRPDGWKTVCIGRFLIDLPASAELGAAKAEYDSSYGFAGINTGNAWGTLRYGDVKITETVAAGTTGLSNIRRQAKAQVLPPESFKKLIKAREDDVAYVVRRMAKSSAQSAADDQELLDNYKKVLREVVYNAKVSGEAKLDDPEGFAIRLGPEYILGFQGKDQRVRTFSGEHMKSKLDSVQGAAEEYRRMRASYRPRLPTDVPDAPGFCTYYGFIDEPQQAEANVQMRVPIQIKQYPNLILALGMEPAHPDSPPNIQKFPNMDAGRNVLDKVGVKRTHGPKAEQILGMPGRSYAQEYGDNCSSTSCRPADQAYDMEARTFGEAGRVDRPRLILHMTAATSDDYKLKRPAQPKGYNVPDRPALSGHVPPPFEVGKQIFDQVLRSIRLRPGAITGQGVPSSSPAPR